MASASACTSRYGPPSSSRDRNSSTTVSRLLASSDTCDFDNMVIPSVSVSFSTRRADTPGRSEVATTEITACSARRRRSSSHSGK